jgi:hypothetical protein
VNPPAQPAASLPTITIEGRTYTVERKDDTGDGPSGKPEGPTYWLRGARGAVYYTMRNVPRPHLMFLVNGVSFTRSAPQTWLTDRTGELTVAGSH